jgi:hypothetical protein
MFAAAYARLMIAGGQAANFVKIKHQLIETANIPEIGEAG